MPNRNRREASLLVSALLAIAYVTTPGSTFASGHSVEKLALSGEVAPGTGGATHDDSFLSVVLNDNGEAAFLNNVSGGVPGWGAFLYGPGGDSALSLEGDVAPGTGGGTYLLAGGFAIRWWRRRRRVSA